MVKTLYWKNNSLYILNQLLLPRTIRFIRCRRYREVARTIKSMAVRGAPAIGVAAAFGIVVASRERSFASIGQLKKYLAAAAGVLAETRPTAVNLFWALERMMRTADGNFSSVAALRGALEKEAVKMYEEDIGINRKIGENGARLLKKHSVILTHCNAGALATAGYGTALGVVRSARRQGKIDRVFVDETRPYLQGARLTAWELRQERIPYVLITDNMAGYFMKTGGITAVIVGADRIAANGDAANKIGTYSLSILARHHGIPFYVAAPVSSIDLKTPDGSAIVIEERSGKEVLVINKRSIAPRGAVALHPGFDVTPRENITAIITERGVFKPEEIKRAVS